jgi:hypothetical protein
MTMTLFSLAEVTKSRELDRFPAKKGSTKMNEVGAQFL